MDDTIEGPNVVYHHGALGGRPGMFIDNPSDPSAYATVFQPSGEPPTPLNQFGLAPEAGPSGEQYFDKIAWRQGPREAIVRVDSAGRPLKAFTLDTGEVHEAAISPFDFFGSAPAELSADALAAAGKLAIRPIGDAVADVVSRQGLRGVADEVAGEAEPAFQLGGAHADVRGVPGYESHHMPADSVSPIRKARGPAIAILPEDHISTASWGNGDAARAFRARQAALLQDGDFGAAQQMDIDNIRAKFGSKYDEAIEQMLDYTKRLGLIK